jgi:hypothetical protein
MVIPFTLPKQPQPSNLHPQHNMPSKQLEGVVFDGHSIDATSRTTTEKLKPVNNIASLIRPNRVREFFDSTGS